MKLYCLLSLLCCCPPTALSLFEDQVGKFDWLIENFGCVTWSRFITVNSQSRALVASENVLALVEPKLGKIIWRKVFGDVDGEISRVELADNGDIYVVHEKRRLLRVFDKTSGSLREEIPFQETASFNSAIDDYGVISKPNIGLFVATRSEIACFTNDENAAWSYSLKTEEPYLMRKIVLPQKSDVLQGSIGVSQGNVAVVTLHSDKVIVLTLDAATGEKSEEFIKTITGSSSECKLEGMFAFCWKEDSLSIVPAFGGKSSETEKENESKLKFAVADVKFIGTGMYLIQYVDSHASLLRIIENGKFEHIALFSNYETHFEILTSNSKSGLIVGVISDESSERTITAFETHSAEKVFTHIIGSQKLRKHGKVTTVAAVSGKNSGKLERVLFSFEDYNLALLGISSESEVSVLWEKDQSLAYGVNVDMCDLNLSETMITLEADFEFASRAKTTILEMFYRRISSHFSQFVNFVTDSYKKISTGTFLTECGAEDSELVRDKFNVNKMVILLTSNGKLLGMLSNSGKIVWSHWFKDFSFATQAGESNSFLFVQRTTDNYKYKPRAVVIGQNKLNGNVALVYFNPISGEVYELILDEGYKAVQVFTIPELADEEEIKSFGILNSQMELTLYPKSEFVKKRFRRRFQHQPFIVMAMKSVSELIGLRYKDCGAGETLWTQSFGPTHKIQSIHAKREGELVDSPGKVQSDRTVLFKYLNPNIVFLVVSPVIPDSSSEETKHFYEFSLIDSINGDIIFSTSMKRISDIQAVHSENWVVFSVWNEKNRRTELTVIELYESVSDDLRNATHFSSFDNTSAPLVLRQSYIYPGFIKSISTTYSEKGLTNKQIIVGTANGAIYPIPKHILDPRRTLAPTQAEREEGVMPYHPVISLPLEMSINYNQTVQMIRGSYAHPAGLESTVLLFNYGLDIFFTQTFPSQMFDVLKDDFEFWIIGTVCSALFLASGVSKKLSVYYGLKRAWK